MSTPPSPSGPGRPVGATPVGARDDGRRKKKGLLWGALALLALLAIALLLSQCGGDDEAGGTDSAGATSSATPGTESSDAASESSPSSPTSSSAAGDGGSAGGAGSIVAGDQSVLELVAGGNAAAALAELEGQDATGTGAQVLSVPADEGFWVGTSDTERVWVQLTGGAGESPYQVQEGDSVDFEGTVVAHDEGFASEVGVDEAEGAAQLTEQGSHLEVDKSAVQLTE